eukprot:GILJ01001049.1.p1 GENE.GILJ01001049.1~~GILJ01001049.1.p1  ORF type:complete len:322 (-),score=42.81 GILJ01001049.1:310-1275(-)
MSLIPLQLPAPLLALLHEHGLRTASDLLLTDEETLSRQLHCDEKVIRELFEAIALHYGGSHLSGVAILQNASQLISIFSTGHTGLDCLLSGGLRAGELLEIVGKSSSGKTQWCLQCCMSVASLPDHAVAFVDVSQSFNPERLVEMSRSRGASSESILSMLSRIHCFSAFDAHRLLDVLDTIMAEASQLQAAGHGQSLRLVVVDSLSTLISPLLGGKQSQGHIVMMQIAQALKTIACQHHIAVLYTNHTVADKDLVKPALGKSWAFVPHTQVTLQRSFSNTGSAQNMGIASVTKSIRSRRGETCSYELGPAGLTPCQLTPPQ